MVVVQETQVEMVLLDLLQDLVVEANGGENTGGGGGGCGHNNGPVSGAGGKGIVIIRYQIP